MLVDDAAFRRRLVGGQPIVVDVERRAVGTQHLVVLAHVEEDVRVVEWRTRAHTLQFLDAYEYFLGAEIVGEVGDMMCGHGV